MPFEECGERRLTCLICQRKTEDNELCSFHLAAYKNLIQQYEAWRKALGISWKDYLREIEMNSVTGDWAREVVNYLSKKEDTKDVGKN
jgi:hypothetical protein